MIVRAPADGRVVGEVSLLGAEDVPDLVARARAALPGWRGAAPHARASVLMAAAGRLRERAQDLARLHATESGKVIAQARREVVGAAGLLEANAAVGRMAAGYLAPTGALPDGEKDLTIVERVPLGVVVTVIPFNFPVELTVEKAAAALAAGNVVLVKPPPQNPLTTMATVEVIAAALADAGAPAGVLQAAPGDTPLSAALCAAPGVDAVSLTGSVRAGVAVAAATATLLRPLHLELGGNGAAVVCDDADLEHVVAESLRGRLLANGQACAATKRIVVVGAGRAEEVTQRLAAAVDALVVGDPEAEESQVGPLIDAAAAGHVAGQVRRARGQGARLAAGRARAEGAFFAPVVLADTPTTADVARDDEIFGPVFTVIPVPDDEAAVSVVNSSALGLTAAVFSPDLPRAMGLAQRLDVGGVVVNGTNNYRPPVVPFGGVGLAGTGREGIGYTYEELTRTRFIAIRGLRPAAATWHVGEAP